MPLAKSWLLLKEPVRCLFLLTQLWDFHLLAILFHPSLYGLQSCRSDLFECSSFSQKDLEILKKFDLVISGSKWNQALLRRQGVDRACLVHQGVDTAVFNPEPVPVLIKRSLVIFSGGKLENRKGQDIVIAAFRLLLRKYPDALLIAAWGNVGHVGLETIAASPHVQGALIVGVLMLLVHGWRPMVFRVLMFFSCLVWLIANCLI